MLKAYNCSWNMTRIQSIGCHFSFTVSSALTYPNMIDISGNNSSLLCVGLYVAHHFSSAEGIPSWTKLCRNAQSADMHPPETSPRDFIWLCGWAAYPPKYIFSMVITFDKLKQPPSTSFLITYNCNRSDTDFHKQICIFYIIKGYFISIYALHNHLIWI